MKKIHFIYTPFTGVGLKNGYRGDEWFKNRIEIFKNYTLNSLLNQTDKWFVHWLSFRQEDYFNPLVTELEEYLKTIDKYNAVMTFDGLMYHDDKYSNAFLTRCMNGARIIRDCVREKRLWMRGEFSELFYNKNKTLLSRLRHSLSFLEKLYGRNDIVFLTRIDSDDMFHKDAVREINTIPLYSHTALMFQNGYIYDINTKKVAEWNPTTNPPFHTILFSGDDFYDAEKHLAYYKDFKSHEDIPRVFDTIRLNEGKYCVTINQDHISTVWDHPFRGKEVAIAVLNDFGVVKP